MQATFHSECFSTPVAETPAAACVVGAFEDGGLFGAGAELDAALDGGLREIAGSSKELSGEAGQAAIIHTLGRITPKRVCVVGLGRRQDLSLDALRTAAGAAANRLIELGCRDLTCALHVELPIEPGAAARAIAEGIAMGGFRLVPRKATAADPLPVRVKFAGSDDAISDAARRGFITGEAANLARQLVYEPGNVLTPTEMAERAMRMAAECGLKGAVLDETDMESLGMGLMLSVSRGSEEKARLIILHHRPRSGRDIDLALVGKGITFDTGGISLKRADGLKGLKGDMAGGAAVLGTMRALALLDVPLNVLGLVPAAENMPSGGASRPGDVVTAFDGATVEVITTDAEGRMVLADALAYTRKLGATRVVDVATLTGAVNIALGPMATGAMTNNQDFFESLRDAATDAGEPVWQLPLWESYKKQIKSDIADLANAAPKAGDSRSAGAIAGGKFLEHFVGDTPWVHLDIAATASGDGSGWMQAGPTGTPVRTLVRLAEKIAAQLS